MLILKILRTVGSPLPILTNQVLLINWLFIFKIPEFFLISILLFFLLMKKL
jgi:hypothetical protein